MARKPVTDDDMRRMSPDEKMKRVDFFVEADSFSQDQLYYKYGRSNRADAPTWINDSQGFGKTIGNIGIGKDRPVTVHFNFAAIGDKWVCFYRALSRFVDWEMIENYIDKNWPVKYDNGTRVARTDASNFHQCYSFCCEKEFDNIGDIDEEWFKKMFDEVAEDVSNGEGLEELEIKKSDNSTVITFAMTGGMYVHGGRNVLYKNNRITIKKDRVVMDLCEMVEGGDLEYGLKRKIEEKIK